MGVGYWLIWVIAGVTAWIVLGLPAGPLAERRGRSGIRWFLLGLVLGPIASLVVLLLPSQRKPSLPAWIDKELRVPPEVEEGLAAEEQEEAEVCEEAAEVGVIEEPAESEVSPEPEEAPLREVAPELPLQLERNPFYFFDGRQARTVQELYRELSNRQDYWGYVRSGDVENWLRYLGEEWAAALAAGYQDSPQEFVECLGEYLWSGGAGDGE